MLASAVIALLAIQDPQAVVRRAVEAAGGEQALRGLRSTSVEYYVSAFGLGQSETWDSPPRASSATGRWTNDWAGNRRVVSQETRAVTGQVTRLRRVTNNGIGFAEAGTQQVTQTVDNPAVVANVEQVMRRDPLRMLLAALDNPGALSGIPGRHVFRGDQHDGVRYAMGPDTMNLYFDRVNGLLSVMETVTDDPVLGDRRTQVQLTRWHAAGAVRYPRQRDTWVNGTLAEHAIATSATTNGPIDEAMFAIPDSLAARAVRGPAPPPAPVTVNMVSLAPGVWRAEGTTHHTLVVEQGSDLVLVEAPQSSARMNAVLDTIRSHYAGKRISVVINTHHHWDHSGGMRAVLAAGLPVITHERNVGFMNRIAAAPKTIAPDELSRRRRNPSVRTVSDSLTVGSGESRVVVYRIPTIHAEDVLAVWVPSARILFTSDVLNPAATLNPAGSRELVDFARARGIDPERYAGGHGAVTPWADVQRAAQ